MLRSCAAAAGILLAALTFAFVSPGKGHTAGAMDAAVSMSIWGRCYAGGQLGQVQAGSVIIDSPGNPATSWNLAGDTFAVETDGGLYGAQAGCDYRLAGTPFVVGLVVDAASAGIDATGTSGLSSDTNAQLTVDRLASVRGRLGIANSDVLLYATAGRAWVDLRVRNFDFDGSPSRPGVVDMSGRQWRDVWVWGGGLEVALWGNWTAFFEALNMDLGDVDLVGTAVNPPGFVVLFRHEDIALTILRGGLNWRF